MRVDQKGNNIGTELISNAIESVGADRVKSVSAQLADTNKDVFDLFRSEWLSDIGAFSNTPLGKSLNNLGFKTFDAQNQYPLWNTK
jgi:filamentous hemagglutinin